MKKQILLLVVLSLYTLIGTAAHWLGGEISYAYLSTSKGKITYTVKVIIYRECLDNNNSFDHEIKVGIYNDDAKKNILRTEYLPLDKQFYLGYSCNSNSESCVELGVYEKTMVFDSTDRGLYLSYARCCRDDLNNAKSQSTSNPDYGFTLLSYIPPAKYRNTSPEFAKNPILFHRVDTLSTDYWIASDHDGDSLVYEIVAPYHGGSFVNPLPDPPLTMEILIPLEYETGYSALNPFGTSGTATLDRFNGKLSIRNNVTGAYAFCIEIKEFRAGKLIGVYRRDFPMIFIPLTASINQVKISLEKPVFYNGFKLYLNWSVCPQVDAKYYTVERREKLSDWSVLTKLEESMRYVDSVQYYKWYYFRVSVFVDNQHVYSNIDSVYTDSVIQGNVVRQGMRLNLYPNPSDKYLFLEHSFTPHYHIFDMKGRLLKTYHEVTNPVSRIDIQDLEPGFYYIYLETQEGWMREKFVKLGG